MAKVEKESGVSPVNLGQILSDLEKAVKIQSISLSDEEVLSTGLLCLDIVLGGGIRPSMMTFAGPEQSAKTTLTISILAASVKQKVGARILWDAENSSGSSMDYVENIFNANGVQADIETLFGVKDKGKFTQMPLIYYRDEGEMDTFYNWLSGFLRRLPDKRFEAGSWWYVYPADQEHKAKFKGQYDRRMSAAQGALYIPAEDGTLQAMVMIDSYPSLLPTSMDEDDPKSGMALQAREFSRHIPRVKGKLRAKRVALLGINQLREAPAVMFKDPNYEPGGQALRFNSDIRLRLMPRALSGVPFNPKGKGQIEKEPSISGEGEDTYRYVHLRAIKNKLSVPNREAWLRIWVEDENSQAKGFCPVWDTFYALSMTGQVSGKRSSMILDLHGLGKAKRPIDWLQFKTLVLGDKKQITAVCARLGYKPFNLRKGLFNLIQRGVMEKLYSENHKTKLKAIKAKEENFEEEDEDD